MRGNVLLSFNNLRAVGSLRQTASSLKKGMRELRNLVSSVNRSEERRVGKEC